jgi:putative membrane protein
VSGEGHLATRPRGWWLPWLFAAATIATQIAWPLTTGGARVATTQTVVLLFAITSVSHAVVYRGVRWAVIYTVIAMTFGLVVEMIGTGTGFPFSPYEYTDVLTPQLFGVPLLIPLAWTMMAYPALLVGRRLTGGRTLLTIPVAAYALASWDVFLDPQMVAEGYWVWLTDAPGLPGIPNIPAVNYAGWLLVSLVLMSLLVLLPGAPLGPGSVAGEAVPAVLYTWTWVGGIVANGVFLGRPAVAIAGGLAMGVVAVPYLVGLRRDAP